MDKKRGRFGDRKDGVWLRDIDSMHVFMPYIMRNRADCEAFLKEDIDLTAINDYLARKNAANPGQKYTLFQVISAALLRTVVLRPRLNRFFAGRRLYQRKYLSLAFVSKNRLSDDGSESLLMLYFDPDFTMETVRDKMFASIKEARSGKTDNSTSILDLLAKFPRLILAIVARLLYILDYFGRVPHALIKEEPNYSTLFLSNLGSIRLNADYHHLNNWGTNSLFVVIGNRSLKPYYDQEGRVEMRDTLSLSMTLDERIADGYYYAQSIRLLRHLLQHPELLEQPANQEVDYV